MYGLLRRGGDLLWDARLVKQNEGHARLVDRFGETPDGDRVVCDPIHYKQTKPSRCTCPPTRSVGQRLRLGASGDLSVRRNVKKIKQGEIKPGSQRRQKRGEGFLIEERRWGFKPSEGEKRLNGNLLDIRAYVVNP